MNGEEKKKRKKKGQSIKINRGGQQNFIWLMFLKCQNSQRAKFEVLNLETLIKFKFFPSNSLICTCFHKMRFNWLPY